MRDPPDNWFVYLLFKFQACLRSESQSHAGQTLQYFKLKLKKISSVEKFFFRLDVSAVAREDEKWIPMVLKFTGKAQNIDFSDILPGLRAAAGGRWWRVAGLGWAEPTRCMLPVHY